MHLWISSESTHHRHGNNFTSSIILQLFSLSQSETLPFWTFYYSLIIEMANLLSEIQNTLAKIGHKKVYK